MMKIVTTLLFSLTTLLAVSQENKTSDFFDKVKLYDFSELWTLGQFEIDNDTVIVIRKEPLGYIGENFQRFHIHFISVIQNHKDTYQYFVYGKTKVKNNICRFQGTIRITSAQTYDTGDVPNLKQGFIKGVYEFFEDPDRAGTGELKGEFKTNFYIDRGGRIKYDALNFVADGFDNNQFEGIWSSYKSKTIKKCNWGDWRIPDSRELDSGAGEFGPDESFEQYGWLTYRASVGITGKMDMKEAIKIETEKWWLKD